MLTQTCASQINVYSLSLVFVLRHHVKEAQSRFTQQDKAISFRQACEVTVDVGEVQVVPRTRESAAVQLQTIPEDQSLPFQTSGGIPSLPKEKVLDTSSTAQLRNESDIALKRLASDLTYTVPMVITMCAALIATLAYLVHLKLVVSKWAVSEVLNDGFGYIWLFFTILTVFVLTANLLRAWRTGRAASAPLQTSKDQSNHCRRIVVSLEQPNSMAIEKMDF